jgi:uncharacterized protein (TIGR03435 family)
MLYSFLRTSSLKVILTASVTGLLLIPSAATQLPPPRTVLSSLQEISASSKPLAFDVVTIRQDHQDPSDFAIDWKLPNEFLADNFPLIATIELAYLPTRWSVGRWGRNQIHGAPAWVLSDRYYIRAKVAAEDVGLWQSPDPQKEKILQTMLRAMLEDRCKLAVHRVMVDGPVYALVLAKSNARMKASVPGEALPAGGVPLLTGGVIVPYVRGTNPRVTFCRISMAEFAAYLSQSAGLPVIDQTGLSGLYDFSISKLEPTGNSSQDPSPPTIWDISELGLKLKAIKFPLETIVIDHIERPSEN